MTRILLAAGVLMLAACSPAPAPTPAPDPAPPIAKPAPAEPAVVEEAPATEETATVAPVAETWELPGTLGPLTTQAELEARFGKDNLREEQFPGAEGDGTYPVLVAFPDDPRKRLELVLDAANKDAPIQELRLRGQASEWTEASGLRPGMNLADLVALNGAPVSFYGLAWDYGGTVQDWHGGKLANAVGNPLFRRVTMAARAGADDANLPQGDATFRSDDPKWSSAGKDLVVGEIGISWPHEGED